MLLHERFGLDVFACVTLLRQGFESPLKTPDLLIEVSWGELHKLRCRNLDAFKKLPKLRKDLKAERFGPLLLDEINYAIVLHHRDGVVVLIELAGIEVLHVAQIKFTDLDDGVPKRRKTHPVHEVLVRSRVTL